MHRPVHRPDPASPLARREVTPPPSVRARRRRSPAQGLRIAFRALGVEAGPDDRDARRGPEAQLTLAPFGESEE